MEKTLTVVLLTGLIALLSCSHVSGSQPGKRAFCQFDSESGRCRASHQRWYYDSSSGECKTFTWGGCGGNFNRFETKSACETVCQPGCQHENCSSACSNGFIIDADGCNTCRCQPGPDQSSCPALECPSTCPQGYLTGSDGCMTCDCRTGQSQTRVSRTSPRRECPLATCYMYCQYGNKKDENGCDICSCKSKEETCGQQQCMKECPAGFLTDSRGCDLCECKTVTESKASCPTNQCLKHCTYGFEKDSLGCDICSCATSRNRTRQFPDCSKTSLCTLHCSYGFIKGRDGCNICKCARRSTARRPARTERRFGKGSSSEDVCGVTPMCTMFCEHGFQKDRKGCDTCFCQQDPSVQPAQLPAGIAADSPAQLPANIPSQLPAQAPANKPSQLPADIDCVRKRCHKHSRCSFGFVKDKFGCDTCVCNSARGRPASKGRSL